MAEKTINSWNVVDTEGRVWRRYAIPEGVTLANGLSKEKIEEELRHKMEQVGVKVMEPVLMNFSTDVQRRRTCEVSVALATVVPTSSRGRRSGKGMNWRLVKDNG